MITLVKLGGSLLTDKKVERSFRPQIMSRIAAELKQAYEANHSLKLIIGHGSGSFGHFEAHRHGTASGVRTAEQWMGFTRVAAVAAELNALVCDELQRVGLPCMRFQPSASATVINRHITSMELGPLHQALGHDLVPLLYGDVAFDEELGGAIISTEAIFTYLTHHMDVGRIILLGEVPGVLMRNGDIIPVINSHNFGSIKEELRGSAGTDVTGGMLQKVSDMLELVRKHRHLTVYICDGTQAGTLEALLNNQAQSGTVIRW